MGLYGANAIATLESTATSNAVMEMFLVDDLLKGPSDKVQEFCVSEAAQVLMERQVLKKPTLMRLSKADDEKRRIKLMAYQLAKTSNSPHYAKLKKYTALRKQEINAIMKQFGPKAEKMAKIAQKEYIKTAKVAVANEPEPR